MDYTSNNNTQRMRQSMGPVDQPNWNGGPNPYANYGFGCYCGSTNNGCC